MINVENLTITFDGTTVVDHISFQINKGERVSIVGESGSGKTMTALAIAGLLSSDAEKEGNILFDGTDLLHLSKDRRRKYQGKDITMIFQEPMTSLNPLKKAGPQIEEVLKLHSDLNGRARKQKVLEAIASVGLQNPEEIYKKYPHELSGGMRQRIMTAMAFVCNPRLIIADEPTTALDVDTQEQVIKLLLQRNEQDRTTMLFISHDLNLVRSFSDRILVMHEGRIVEQGSPEKIFEHPEDPYTRKLIAAGDYKRKDVNDEIVRDNILKVDHLSVSYTQKKQKVMIIDDVSFAMKKGEILGLAGKSGSGKTTLSKAILGLHKEYTGTIQHYSIKPQMVFQDPYSSLNPVKRIGWILEEPLRMEGKLAKNERKERVYSMLQKVGLDAGHASRFPNELSGGQRQRVSIALSLISGSEFIIADEPVSALDVTIQSQILELLLSLQKEFQLSILFISHDRRVMERVCDRIIRLENGKAGIEYELQNADTI